MDSLNPDNREDLAAECLRADYELVRAASQIVKSGKMPSPRHRDPFPFAIELLRWALTRPVIHSSNRLIEAIFNPSDGEELIMERAKKISEVFSLLELSFPDIPEWGVRNEAEEKWKKANSDC